MVCLYILSFTQHTKVLSSSCYSLGNLILELLLSQDRSLLSLGDHLALIPGVVLLVGLDPVLPSGTATTHDTAIEKTEGGRESQRDHLVQMDTATPSVPSTNAREAETRMTKNTLRNLDTITATRRKHKKATVRRQAVETSPQK